MKDINRKLGDVREGIHQLHQEDTDVFEKTFWLETSTVIEVFKSIGNSLLETECSLIHITTKLMLGDKASNSVRITEQIWRELYNIFRLPNASASVYDNIKKNNLSLFVQKNSIVSSKSKQ